MKTCTCISLFFRIIHLSLVPSIIVFMFFSAAAGEANNGDHVMTRTMGAILGDSGAAISVTSSGNVCTTGHFSGTADFYPGAETFNQTSAGSSDIFISKLDINGNFVWAIAIGGTSSASGNSIFVDSSGNVYTMGHFSGTADFDPGAGISSLTSSGSSDIFISKLDSNGNFVWAIAIGGTSYDSGTGISMESSGSVSSTGHFSATGYFATGTGTSHLTSAGFEDIFISKLTSSGSFVWVKAMGGTLLDGGTGISVDSSGNIYTSGYFSGIADFDLGAGIINLTGEWSDDIFISKLIGPEIYPWFMFLPATTGNKQL
ncbi:MAG: hypothetical protein KKD01_07885 [Proteobacteria bacterium]|nr:hypothetical protein [Pseudomonadota bacterium]MBU1419840.1 hypothetical protein [Pseudomonadota bacterium]MBU1454637.1 hypothetical protein [Pseudomonadota bacterium]